MKLKRLAVIALLVGTLATGCAAGRVSTPFTMNPSMASANGASLVLLGVTALVSGGVWLWNNAPEASFESPVTEDRSICEDPQFLDATLIELCGGGGFNG